VSARKSPDTAPASSDREGTTCIHDNEIVRQALRMMRKSADDEVKTKSAVHTVVKNLDESGDSASGISCPSGADEACHRR